MASMHVWIGMMGLELCCTVRLPGRPSVIVMGVALNPPRPRRSLPSEAVLDPLWWEE
jgi:hypothetical protein